MGRTVASANSRVLVDGLTFDQMMKLDLQLGALNLEASVSDTAGHGNHFVEIALVFSGIDLLAIGLAVLVTAPDLIVDGGSEGGPTMQNTHTNQTDRK